MFIKKTRSKNKTYYSIVETYREEGKVKHRVILKLGDAEDEKTIEDLALKMLKAVKSGYTVENLDELEELSRVNWGVSEVYKVLWERFEMDEILNIAWKGRSFSFNARHAVFMMLLDRVSSPCSKLKTFERQANRLGQKTIPLQHLYRSLDLLADAKEEIEKSLFLKNRTLFNMTVDVVFYDVTTFYFESHTADELKEFGFSKDHKNNEVQVVMGLLMDAEGRPVGFDLYPGNTYEGKTVQKTISKLKKRFEIGKLIWVSDRGLCAAENLLALKEAGYEYIVGARLKNMTKAIQKEALDVESYQTVKKEGETPVFRYKILENLGERIVCTWSLKRASKDKKDRERLVQKAEAYIQSPSKLSSKRGVRKYIKTTNKVQGLDADKITGDAIWDGIYGIRTNNMTMTQEEIQEAYHQLWRIEECFRVLKTNLQTRPIFHFTQKRIKGHFVLCFMAFLLERTLEIILQKEKVDYSVDKIRQSLNALQLSVLQLGEHTKLVAAKPDLLAKSICKILKITKPKGLSRNVV